MIKTTETCSKILQLPPNVHCDDRDGTANEFALLMPYVQPSSHCQHNDNTANKSFTSHLGMLCHLLFQGLFSVQQ